MVHKVCVNPLNCQKKRLEVINVLKRSLKIELFDSIFNHQLNKVN